MAGRGKAPLLQCTTRGSWWWICRWEALKAKKKEKIFLCDLFLRGGSLMERDTTRGSWLWTCKWEWWNVTHTVSYSVRDPADFNAIEVGYCICMKVAQVSCGSADIILLIERPMCSTSLLVAWWAKYKNLWNIPHWFCTQSPKLSLCSCEYNFILKNSKKIEEIQGGFADRASGRLWTNQTRTVVFSTTKVSGLFCFTPFQMLLFPQRIAYNEKWYFQAVGALCVAMLVDRGHIR